jgi:hypothetical protein
MMRWVRFVGAAMNATPILLITLVLMVGAWAAAAQIYAITLQVAGSGEFAILVLVGLNVVCSWLLVFRLSGFVHDLQELRLPKQRRLLAGGSMWIFAFIFAAPCALVWSLNGGAGDITMVAMGSLAGSSGALLWRWRSQARTAPGVRVSVPAVAPAVPAQRPSPWRAVRLALGPPYAPASWQRRGIQLATLCAVVSGAPFLALLYEGSLQPRAFPYVLHAAQFLGFMAAIGLCWVWPLSRLLAIFNPERGTLSELVLLPGLGSGAQQLGRLCLVAVGLPFVGLLLLYIGAMALVMLQHLPHDLYRRVSVNFLMIPLITVPILLTQTSKAQMPATWSLVVLMFSQMWTFSFLLWSGIGDPGVIASVLGHTVSRLAAGLVLAAVIIVIGFSIHSIRKLLQRPHPFVEISS